MKMWSLLGIGALALTGCSTVPKTEAIPSDSQKTDPPHVASVSESRPLSEPITVWIYAEDEDYRTRDLVSEMQQEVRRSDELATARKSARITIALSRNVVLPERYGEDAFSAIARVLIDGIPRDRFGATCRQPRDLRCVQSTLRHAKERMQIIDDRHASQDAVAATD